MNYAWHGQIKRKTTKTNDVSKVMRNSNDDNDNATGMLKSEKAGGAQTNRRTYSSPVRRCHPDSHTFHHSVVGCRYTCHLDIRSVHQCRLLAVDQLSHHGLPQHRLHGQSVS